MVAPTIAYNGESTRQGSVPFAHGGDTLVAAAVFTTRTAAVSYTHLTLPTIYSV